MTDTTIRINAAVLEAQILNIEKRLDDANINGMDAEIAALKARVNSLTWLVRTSLAALGGLLLELAGRSL